MACAETGLYDPCFYEAVGPKTSFRSPTMLRWILINRTIAFLNVATNSVIIYASRRRIVFTMPVSNPRALHFFLHLIAKNQLLPTMGSGIGGDEIYTDVIEVIYQCHCCWSSVSDGFRIRQHNYVAENSNSARLAHPLSLG